MVAASCYEASKALALSVSPTTMVEAAVFKRAAILHHQALSLSLNVKYQRNSIIYIKKIVYSEVQFDSNKSHCYCELYEFIKKHVSQCKYYIIMINNILGPQGYYRQFLSNLQFHSSLNQTTFSS
jgi:hypothetical protein